MDLLCGFSQTVIEKNIRTMVANGFPESVAYQAALRLAREAREEHTRSLEASLEAQ